MLLSFSCAKSVLLEVVMPRKQLARSKDRTDVQEKKGADALTFSSRDHKEWGLQRGKRDLVQTLG